MKLHIAPTMIDLFSGCGGVTTGFKAKGFKVLAMEMVYRSLYRGKATDIILF